MKMILLETRDIANMLKISLQEAYQNSPVQDGVKDVGDNIYVVLTVTMLVWLGLFAYMVMMNKRVKDVEEQLDRMKK